MNLSLTHGQREVIARAARPGPLTIYQLDDICRAIACLELNPEYGTPTLSRPERERIEELLREEREKSA